MTALHCYGEPAFASEQPASPFDESLGHASPLRILVAEDNEINRKVVLRMLAGFGYQADIAHDGAQVMEAVRQKDYDLVLMDIEMPVVDGIEATNFIMNNIAAQQRPRVVAMSASVMREDAQAALAAEQPNTFQSRFPRQCYAPRWSVLGRFVTRRGRIKHRKCLKIPCCLWTSYTV